MFKLYFFLLVACLNSTINGYDGSIMSGINAMESYQKYFDMNTVGTKTGLVFSSYTIGNIIGSFFCGPFTDWWGRRWGMFIGAALIIFGTLVQAPATNTPMFVGGRFILGFGVATCATAGPSYVAEMAHPAWRGTLTGLYNTFWFVGGIPASWVVYASRNLPNNISWRLPIWLQCVAAGLVLLFCLFCPETPRWLISNDRHAEALHVLATYHGEGNPRSPLVLLSIREMMEEIATEGSDKRWWDYRSLFNTRAAWWRMVCVSGMAFLTQWCGNGVVTYFLPPLLDIIGVTDEGTQLQYNGFLNIIQFVMATLGARFTDHLGRRPVLIYGTALLIFWWLAITTLTGIYQTQIIHCHQPPGEAPIKPLSRLAQKVCAFRNSPEFKTPPWSAAIIALIYLFGITYSFAYTPLQALYPVECLGYEERAKGMGWYNLMTNVAMFFNTFAVPTLLEKIGWRVFFLYVAWNSAAVVVIYLFFVETKGRTLEEINDIFEDPYPRKRSLVKHMVVVTSDGVVLNKLGSA
ncbi:general substrate transporter [Ascodesmis nigricans]|uniref:General substrate transporter n=1 Tax=Ascodesmis nigricans TaxID=341454 RepID=A0A4S2N3H3_9PEZI|nr:general substrate transporter [Ascodesmis nigricans]